MIRVARAQKHSAFVILTHAFASSDAHAHAHKIPPRRNGMRTLRCTFMIAQDGTLREARIPGISFTVDGGIAMKDVNAKLQDVVTKYVSSEFFVVKGVYRQRRDRGRADSYSQNRHKLGGDTTVRSVCGDHRELAMFLVLTLAPRNSMVTTWTPPRGSGNKPSIKISVTLDQDNFPHEEAQQRNVSDGNEVKGHFVKFSVDEKKTFTACRYEGSLPRSKVQAVSYAWGTLPHAKRLRVVVFNRGETSDNSKEKWLQLGKEWDVGKLQAKLLDLSKTHWLWLDQLCLGENKDISKELCKEVSKIYASCQVHAFIATTECGRFQELQRSYKDTGEDRNDIEHHINNCKCSNNWQVYFGRIWPWQELAVAHKVEFHLGLGLANVNTHLHRSDTVKKARTQVAVKLADRFYAMRDEDSEQVSRKAAVLVLLGWSIESPRRTRISDRETFDFLTHFVKAGRKATVSSDFVYALLPLLKLDIKMDLDAIPKERRLKPALDHLEKSFIGAMNSRTRAPFALAWLKAQRIGERVVDTNDLLPRVRSSATMETDGSGAVRGHSAVCSVKEVSDASSIVRYLSTEQRGELLAFCGTGAGEERDRQFLIALSNQIQNRPHTPTNVSSRSMVTALSMALGYVAPSDANRFRDAVATGDGRTRLELVGVKYDAIGSTTQLRALAIRVKKRETRPMLLCSSGNASLIGTRGDASNSNNFFVCGQVLGSRVHHSIRMWCTRHTLETLLNKKIGSSVVKMPDAQLHH